MNPGIRPSKDCCIYIYIYPYAWRPWWTDRERESVSMLLHMRSMTCSYCFFLFRQITIPPYIYYYSCCLPYKLRWMNNATVPWTNELSNTFYDGKYPNCNTSDATLLVALWLISHESELFVHFEVNLGRCASFRGKFR